MDTSQQKQLLYTNVQMHIKNLQITSTSRNGLQ